MLRIRSFAGAVLAIATVAFLIGCSGGQRGSSGESAQHAQKGEPVASDVGIYTIELDTQQVRHLDERGYVLGRAPNGSILYAPSYEELRVMNDDGSGARVLLHLRNDRQFSVSPDAWAPGGKKLAISISGPNCDPGCTNWSVWIVDFATGRRHRVITNGNEVSWSPDGSTLAFVNPVFPEYSGADHFAIPPHHIFLVSPRGGRRRLFVRGRAPWWLPGRRGLIYEGERTYYNPETENISSGVWTVGRGSPPRRIMKVISSYDQWTVSPRGRQVAKTLLFGGIAVRRVEGGRVRILARGKREALDTGISWSPSGKAIAWSRFSSRRNLERLLISPADASTKPRELVRTGHGGRIDGLVFSADGKQLVFSVRK